MYHMRTASVRDLRYDFKKIEHMLAQGEEVQITKRKRVIARLVPEKAPERPPMPDFLGRMKAIYGDKVHEVSGAELIRMDRDRFLTTYVDTSFLVSLYCPDINAGDAFQTMQATSTGLWITPFVELEFVNALDLRVFRKEDAPSQSESAVALFEQDLRAGLFQLKPLPEYVFLRARQLSRRTTAKMGTRASEILHVAAALELGVNSFYTFDRQQAKLAQSVKLRTNVLPERARGGS
jgi:antitoxin (DNA-binding transcriptional repressor) of toxin-antitoxin stability system/predicted nucleic acid-binding protein